MYTSIKYGKVFIPICHVGLDHALVLTFILSPSGLLPSVLLVEDLPQCFAHAEGPGWSAVVHLQIPHYEAAAAAAC